MNAAGAAALIAAVFWALLVSVGVFVLFRLGRLLSESTRLVGLPVPPIRRRDCLAVPDRRCVGGYAFPGGA